MAINPGENDMTAKELAKAAGVSAQRIRQILAKGNIQGAYKFGYTWVIPRAAADLWLASRSQIDNS